MTPWVDESGIMRINWALLSEGIVAELNEMPANNRQVRMRIDVLFARTGALQEPIDFRHRAFWASIQRGGNDWDMVRRFGLVINFEPDESGRPVEFATFRLNQFQV